jgi:hypothetical protein
MVYFEGFVHEAGGEKSVTNLERKISVKMFEQQNYGDVLIPVNS